MGTQPRPSACRRSAKRAAQLMLPVCLSRRIPVCCASSKCAEGLVTVSCIRARCCLAHGVRKLSPHPRCGVSPQSNHGLTADLPRSRHSLVPAVYALALSWCTDSPQVRAPGSGHCHMFSGGLLLTGGLGTNRGLGPCRCLRAHRRPVLPQTQTHSLARPQTLCLFTEAFLGLRWFGMAKPFPGPQR